MKDISPDTPSEIYDSPKTIHKKKLIDIPSFAVDILREFTSRGFNAYIVGGFVRDSLLGIKSADLDITTSASPENVKRVFSGDRVIETGIKHGTVTVLRGKVSAEITTFRSDGVYTDNRHPDEVVFASTLDDDLSRRDFTVNALCAGSDGVVIDRFDGLGDLERRLVRAIGDPDARFREDALRILRALRFAAVYGFCIEKNTAAAVHRRKELLKNISRERIFAELSRMVCGENIESVLNEYFDVFAFIIPELSGMKGFDQRNFHHKFDILGHTARVVASAPPELDTRLAALFHDCGKVDTFSLDESGTGHFFGHAAISARKAEFALKRLRADNAVTDTVINLVRFHDSPIEETRSAAKRRLNKHGEALYRKLIALQRADTAGLADEFAFRFEHFDRLESILDDVLAEEACFSLKSLAVNGRDLIELGFAGAEIGRRLDFLLNAVIDGKVENEREKLLEHLKLYEEK